MQKTLGSQYDDEEFSRNEVSLNSIGIAILTLNAEKHLPFCLPPLLESSLKPKILLIDSNSTDETVKIAKEMGVDAITIEGEFNHGLTREFARKKLATDIVVFITQDAYLFGSDDLRVLIKPLIEGKASLAYGRQLPHKGAGFFEAFPRYFNYKSVSELRDLKSVDSQGSATYFFSDSFSAYLNKALDEVGGFKKVLLGEDTIAAAELIHKGHRLAYIAEACVFHSHSYSLLQEFSRYFDTGLMRKEYGNYLQTKGSDQRKGKEYAKELFKQIISKKPWLIPFGFFHILAKWLGYRLGAMSVNASTTWKCFFSSQKYYWRKNSFS